jgi:hypothetical protein
MKKNVGFLLLTIFILSNSFGQTGAKNPSIMIFPSNNLLKSLDCLKTIKNQDTEEDEPLYKKAFTESTDLLLAIQAINKKFLAVDYPTKSLAGAIDEAQAERVKMIAQGIKPSLEDIIVANAKPDIKCILSYEFKKGGLGSQLSFVFEALDSYSNESIASIGSPGIQTTNNNIAQMIADQVERNMEGFLNEINRYFERMKEDGRKIKLLINVTDNSTVDLENDECSGEFLMDLIEIEIKKNAYKNSYKLNSSSDKQMRFQDIAIPIYGDDGIGISAKDWLKPIINQLRRTCKLKISDKTTGLGDGNFNIN